VPRLSCFNCNGNHTLRDCPEPKNQSNINKNRKEYAMKNSAGVRYHMGEDQRFGHMVPGQLSQKLRKALGLKENQLPKHIYRYYIIYRILEKLSFVLLNRCIYFYYHIS
jgi:zinc finger CCHC domain-containing protein 8